jgi:hypothetical protein
MAADPASGMAQDDWDEFNRLSQELIKRAAGMMADDADQMIASLAKGLPTPCDRSLRGPRSRRPDMTDPI